MVADIADYFSQPLLIGGEFSVFDILAYEVAQDSSEILMARKGKKTPGIRNHPNKAAEDPHI